MVAMERDLQTLVEKNLQTFLGVRLLAHEHGTGRVQRGQIDSLGIDENNCPVIIEYKKRNNENIITQALYYLDWLLDHQGDFIQLAARRLGEDIAKNIEFSGARILCVASDFSRFDERAVCQIDRNIELIRYKFFGDHLLLLERLNPPVNPFQRATEDIEARDEKDSVGMPLRLRLRIQNMSPQTESLYLDLLAYAETLGDDVGIKFLKHYVALSRMKNFTCIQPMKSALKIWLNLDPDETGTETGFSRDVRNVGHHASGNLEIDLHSPADLERAKPLIELAYQLN